MCSKCVNVNVEIISQAFHEKTTVDEITQVNDIHFLETIKCSAKSIGQ